MEENLVTLAPVAVGVALAVVTFYKLLSHNSHKISSTYCYMLEDVKMGHVKKDDPVLNAYCGEFT